MWWTEYNKIKAFGKEKGHQRVIGTSLEKKTVLKMKFVSKEEEKVAKCVPPKK